MSASRQTRLAVGAAVACLLLTSGCMGLGDLGSSIDVNRAEKVSYNAEVVGEAPAAATVVDSDDLGNASALEPLLADAVGSDESYANLVLRGSDAENVTGTMSEFPFYEDGKAWYFEHDGEVVRVSRLE